MCVSCGCLRPDDTHGDERAIVLADLQAAADQCGCSVADVAANITKTLAVCGCAAEPNAPAEKTAAVVVLKAASERRFTLGVAYPANKPDVVVAADGHRDFASPDALEKTAWEWMSKHRDVNLFHRADTSGHATVVESYIYRGPDWRITSPRFTSSHPGSSQIVPSSQSPAFTTYACPSTGEVILQSGPR